MNGLLALRTGVENDGHSRWGARALDDSYVVSFSDTGAKIQQQPFQVLAMLIERPGETIDCARSTSGDQISGG